MCIMALITPSDRLRIKNSRGLAANGLFVLGVVPFELSSSETWPAPVLLRFERAFSLFNLLLPPLFEFTLEPIVAKAVADTSWTWKGSTSYPVSNSRAADRDANALHYLLYRQQHRLSARCFHRCFHRRFVLICIHICLQQRKRRRAISCTTPVLTHYGSDPVMSILSPDGRRNWTYGHQKPREKSLPFFSFFD
jgi:hypothetical protein